MGIESSKQGNCNLHGLFMARSLRPEVLAPAVLLGGWRRRDGEGDDRGVVVLEPLDGGLIVAVPTRGQHCECRRRGLGSTSVVILPDTGSFK
jgi:hypothetical protein